MVLGYLGDTKYNGKEKIVVAMDIGTTQSAVSFSYLYPGDYARIRMVNKWPGQPDSIGSSKIPSLVAYRYGQCKACGPEALEYIDDSNYSVAKWFKLHLHPSSMKRSSLPPPYGSGVGSAGFEIPVLPPSVSVDRVYTDFIEYLMENVQTSFEQSIPNGAAIWQRLRDTLVLVLTTPNGWDLFQQSVLRKAVMASGAIKADKTLELLEFVTEGEASVHYALAYSQSKTWLVKDSVFAVIDAGGSTVDSTLYKCKSADPRVMLEEICPCECIQAGGIFVDRAVERILKERLKGSHFGDDECIADMVTAFEIRTKRLFDASQTSYAVDFGSSRDTDRLRGIIKGKVSMTMEEVSSAFEDVIQRITSNCSRLLDGHKIEYILLVGGFGESPYLQSKLIELFDRQGVKLVTVEEPAKKAAAEGAMIWFVQQNVTARIARYTLGTNVSVSYQTGVASHVQRAEHVVTDPSGKTLLPNKFLPLLTKARGTRIHSDLTVTKPFSTHLTSLNDALDSFRDTIEIWEGDGTPEWTINVNGRRLLKMRTLCILTADISGLRSSLKALYGPRGKYYAISFKIAIRFGGTQLHALLQWEEDGRPREGPVTIIPSTVI